MPSGRHEPGPVSLYDLYRLLFCPAFDTRYPNNGPPDSFRALSDIVRITFDEQSIGIRYTDQRRPFGVRRIQGERRRYIYVR